MTEAEKSLGEAIGDETGEESGEDTRELENGFLSKAALKDGFGMWFFFGMVLATTTLGVARRVSVEEKEAECESPDEV